MWILGYVVSIFGSSGLLGHVVSILGSSGIGRVLPGEELGKVAAICRFLSQLSCTGALRRLRIVCREHIL